jgi:DNA polymerase-4
MDAFFASVEQQSNPALRDKPIAVTGAGARTIITTASYEARAFRVKTGMTLHEAKPLPPRSSLLLAITRSMPIFAAGSKISSHGLPLT